MTTPSAGREPPERPGQPSRDGGTTGCDDEGMRRFAAAPPTPGQPRLLSERGLIGARAAGWGLAVLAVFGGVAGLVAQGLRDSLTAMDVLIFVPFMAFGVVGGLIAARRPGNPLGWLCGVGGAAVGLFNMASYGGQYAVANGRTGPGVSAAAWVVGWTPPIGLGLLLTFVPLLFPTGSLPSPRWRPVAWTAGVAHRRGRAGGGLRSRGLRRRPRRRQPLGTPGRRRRFSAPFSDCRCLS